MVAAPVNSKEPRPSDPTLASMLPALRKYCLEIRKLLTKEARGSALTRYQAAVIIRKVRDGSAKRYGADAIGRLARALGLNESTLYDHVSVAERWDGASLKALLKRRGKHGVPLSWSHLVELAKVMDDTRREGLVQATLAEGLSVRELRDRIIDRLKKAPAVTEGPYPVPTAAISGLREMTSLAGSWTERLSSWREAVFTPIREASQASLDAPFLDQLRQAFESQLRLREACEENLKQLQECLAQLDGPVASPSATGPKKS